MGEGYFDAEGYYHATVNGIEIIFESWQAYKDFVSDDEKVE